MTWTWRGLLAWMVDVWRSTRSAFGAALEAWSGWPERARDAAYRTTPEYASEQARRARP